MIWWWWRSSKIKAFDTCYSLSSFWSLCRRSNADGTPACINLHCLAYYHSSLSYIDGTHQWIMWYILAGWRNTNKPYMACPDVILHNHCYTGSSETAAYLPPRHCKRNQGSSYRKRGCYTNAPFGLISSIFSLAMEIGWASCFYGRKLIYNATAHSSELDSHRNQPSRAPRPSPLDGSKRLFGQTE